MKQTRLILAVLGLLLLSNGVVGQVTVSGAHASSNGDYTTLRAAFNAINGQVQTGNSIVVTITASTDETVIPILNSGSWTSLTIYPTAENLSLLTDSNHPVITLAGASNVTIDGRVNQAGEANLTINNSNTSTLAAAVKFVDGASSNTIKYCYLKGSSSLQNNSAIVHFAGTSTTTGNSSNTIEYCNFTNSGGNRPYHAILSNSESSYLNASNIVRYNYFYDNLGTNGAQVVRVQNYGSAWQITGNSFFETSSIAPSGSNYYEFISIQTADYGNYTISNNYIGGSASECGGVNPLTKTINVNKFYGINLYASSSITSNVQGNTISNISWRNTITGTTGNYFFGIALNATKANVGTETGNTIGSASETNAIVYTDNFTGTNLYGIFVTGNAAVDIQNNTIGGVTVANSNSANSTNFYGIHIATGTGTLNCSSNTIGSLSTSNSIYASSASTTYVQIIYGIECIRVGTISNNTIANLTNGSTNTSSGSKGRLHGINISTTGSTLEGNTIKYLKTSNANSKADHEINLGGIVVNMNIYNLTIAGNTISHLENDRTTFAGSIAGIYVNMNYTDYTIDLSKNFIHSLSVNSSSTAANIYGIKKDAGVMTAANNIVSINANSLTNVYGIYETGATDHSTNLYYNTVYLGGTIASGTNKSYALWSNSADNAREFHNNILANERSTVGGSNLHYAAYLNYSTDSDLRISNNCYFTPGTGGVPGYYASTNKTELPIVPYSDDASSLENPVLLKTDGTNATDYIQGTVLIGREIAGVSVDFEGTTRATTPDMGAFEMIKWNGTGDWSVTTNWSTGAVPSSTSRVYIESGLLGIKNNVEVSSLTISPYSSVTINNKSASITLTADKLILNSNAKRRIASLINKETIAANEILVKRYLPSTAFEYISSPIENQTASVFGTLSSTASSGKRLFSYNNASGWVSITDGAEALTAMKGFTYANFADAQTVTFSGTAFHSGNQTIALTKTGLDGFNLVGNPYPSAIVWYEGSGWERTNVATSIWINVANTAGDASFAVYNKTGPSEVNWTSNIGDDLGFIAQTQAFWVYAEDNTSLTVKPDAQVHSENIVHKRSAEENTLIRLQALREGYTDEGLIFFHANATEEIDSYDTRKMMGSGAFPQLFMPSAEGNLAINALPVSLLSEKLVVPVAIKSDRLGSITLAATEFSGFESSQSIILVDKALNRQTNLRDGAYTFTVESTQPITDRFEVVIERVQTSIDEVLSPAVRIYASGKNIYVAEANKATSIEVYNALGQRILSRNLTGQPVSTIGTDLPRGIYIVSVSTPNGRTTKRIYIE